MVENSSRLPTAVILYDDDCGLCHNFIQFLLKIDKKGRFSFAPQGGSTAARILDGREQELKGIDSVYFVLNTSDSPQVFFYSDAALQTLKVLGYPWKAFWWFSVVPRFLRDGIYRFLARHRYGIFGERSECLVDVVDDDKKDRFLD